MKIGNGLLEFGIVGLDERNNPVENLYKLERWYLK